MPGYKEWANHPSRKKLPKAEIDRRWKQRVLTLQTKSRTKPGVTYKQVVIAQKPQPMKRNTQKSKGGGKPNKTQKAYGQTTKMSLRPMGGRIQTWVPLSCGRTPQGSVTYPMKFEVMWATSPVTSDGTGAVALSIQIIGSLWSQFGIEAARFRKVRLREFAVEYVPKVGMNVNGSMSQYFNYSGTAAVPVNQAAASKVEGVVPGLVPYKQHFFRWRKQDNVDDEFVISTAGAVFNAVGHYFKLVGDGFASTQVLGDLYLMCIVEFTEYIS